MKKNNKPYPINVLNDIEFRDLFEDEIDVDNPTDAQKVGLEAVINNLGEDASNVMHWVYRDGKSFAEITRETSHGKQWASSVIQRSLYDIKCSIVYNEMIVSGFTDFEEARNAYIERLLKMDLTEVPFWFLPFRSVRPRNAMYYSSATYIDSVIDLVNSPGWYMKVHQMGPKSALELMNLLKEMGLIDDACPGWAGLKERNSIRLNNAENFSSDIDEWPYGFIKAIPFIPAIYNMSYNVRGVDTAVRDLPEADYNLIYLRFIERLSWKAMSQRLDCSECTIKGMMDDLMHRLSNDNIFLKTCLYGEYTHGHVWLNDKSSKVIDLDMNPAYCVFLVKCGCETLEDLDRFLRIPHWWRANKYLLISQTMAEHILRDLNYHKIITKDEMHQYEGDSTHERNKAMEFYAGLATADGSKFGGSLES